MENKSVDFASISRSDSFCSLVFFIAVKGESKKAP